MDIPKITTFLMFNNQAEEAVKLYTSLFEDSEIITMAKYGENGPGDPGTVQHSIFTLNGQVFMAIDANKWHRITNESCDFIICYSKRYY